MTLVEQGPFKVGDTVHFAYAPKTDDLVGGRTDDIGTAEELEARAKKASRQTIVPAGELGFYPSGDLGRQLGTTPLLPGEGGPVATLRFAGVTPGKYMIVPTGQGFRATTKATRCEGVRTCIAMPATTRPLEIELK